MIQNECLMYELTSLLVMRSGRTVDVAPPDSPLESTSSTVTLDAAHVKKTPTRKTNFIFLEHHEQKKMLC